MFVSKSMAFRLNVAATYSEICPELSRIIMDESLKAGNGSKSNLPINFRGRFCEHCGTMFTSGNSKYRLKSKRKGTKTKSGEANGKNQTPNFDTERLNLPKESNYLEILCKYCGWKTRHVGARRKARTLGGSSKSPSKDGTPKTPHTPGNRLGQNLSGKWSVTPKTTPGLKKGPGSKTKSKTTLKALLAEERELAKEKTSSPSLLDFLASV